MRAHHYSTCDECGKLTIGKVIEANGATDREGFKWKTKCHACKKEQVHTMRVTPDGSLAVHDHEVLSR